MTHAETLLLVLVMLAVYVIGAGGKPMRSIRHRTVARRRHSRIMGELEEIREAIRVYESPFRTGEVVTPAPGSYHLDTGTGVQCPHFRSGMDVCLPAQTIAEWIKGGDPGSPILHTPCGKCVGFDKPAIHAQR